MSIALVTRILIADDHTMVRRGVRQVLDREPLGMRDRVELTRYAIRRGLSAP